MGVSQNTRNAGSFPQKIESSQRLNCQTIPNAKSGILMGQFVSLFLQTCPRGRKLLKKTDAAVEKNLKPQLHKIAEMYQSGFVYSN